MSSALLSSATSSAGARRGASLSVDDPRLRVAAARRILARGGCESGVAGHVSLRGDDGNSFWTSGFEYFDETTLRPSCGPTSTSSSSRARRRRLRRPEFHSAIYRSRSDVGAIIHIHSHWVSTFVSSDGPIGMYNVGAVVFHEEQAMLVDDGTRPPVEGHRVVAALAGRSVVLVKNHGAIVVASTSETATVLALMLEQAARARDVGGELRPARSHRSRPDGLARHVMTPVDLGAETPPLDGWGLRPMTRAKHWNDDPTVFIGSKIADDIIARTRRGRAAINHLTNSEYAPLVTTSTRPG